MTSQKVNIFTALLILVATTAAAGPTSAPVAPPLPKQTSKYNKGGEAGRYRDEDRDIKKFALRRPASLYDGGGREIGKVSEPVLLNIGAAKQMDLDGKPGNELYEWAWKTPAGSGWIARNALVDPPPVKVDPNRNPKPPHESDSPLVIDAAAGREQLKGLVHTNSQGILPTTGGNKGEHYAGRNPGQRDFVYLLFACPNVQRGGVAKDSLPDGSRFIAALDEQSKPIEEIMTMYRNGDPKQPVRVTFIYGRAEDGETYGWLARANVGER